MQMLRSITIIWPVKWLYYSDFGHRDYYREFSGLSSPLAAVKVLNEQCEQVKLKLVIQLHDQNTYHLFNGFYLQGYWFEPLTRIRGLKEVEVVLWAHGKGVGGEEAKRMRDEIAKVLRGGEGLKEGRWRKVTAGLAPIQAGWEIPGVFEARRRIGG
jgi:hypothetical protein